MKDLIDPRTGELMDFEWRHGDPLPPAGRRRQTSNRQRWGSRILLATPQSVFAGAPGIISSSTMIDTGDLGRDFPINVQIRWGNFDLSNPLNPPAVFSEVNPIFVPNGTATFKVRRGVDPTAPVAVDTYTMNLAVIDDVSPIDIITARALGLEVSLSGNPQSAVWVEAIATIVTDIAVANRLVGWKRVQNLFIPAVASPGNAVLLQAKNGRVQFIVVNTSTNADMIIRFGTNATWVGPSGSIVLPFAVPFSSYESPVGGYKEIVSASWNNAAPNGGALVTEGSYF